MNAPLVAAVLATVVCAAGYSAHAFGLLRMPGLETLELDSLDVRFRLRGNRQPASDDIVIVGIDDETRRRAPAIFQKREAWARLVRELAAHDPAAIGIDALFSSPEISLPDEVVAEVKEAHEALAAEPERSPGAERALGALGAVIDSLRGDALLAAAVEAAGSVHLAIHFLMPDPARDLEPAPPGAEEPAIAGPARFGEAVAVARPPEERPRDARAYVQGSLEPIAAGAEAAGFVNVLVDRDGVVRRIPAVIARAGRYYMPLGLSMALARAGGDASYVTGAEHVTAAGAELPVGPRAEFRLSFLGPAKTFPHVSAADVLAGEVPRQALEGKLVFVGYTDTARDKDQTPLDPAFPGVEIHATLAHNILHRELLRPTDPLVTVATILALGAALALLQIRRIRQRRAWVIGVAVLGAVALYAIAAHAAFAAGDVVVDVAAPVLSCVVIALASLSAAVATEGREKAELKAAFSQYVNDAVVDRILSDPTRARLGGVRRELTVVFSDIRGFSQFSENLEPEALSEYLNEYLTPMTHLVMDEGGMLDKYIGDAVMAVYGAPLSQRDHAERACRTALAMQGALEPLNARWRERGLPEIAVGIGVNSGAMSVGNMGSEARFDYTVMGDAVNLGARLEGLTKDYRVGILCGERTAELAGDAFVFRELDYVRVKGRAGTARIFELVAAAGRSALSADDLDRWGEALAAYRDQEWDRAETGFAEFLDRHPHDGPAEVLRARCRHLVDNPPPPDWDGVYVQGGGAAPPR